MLHRDGTKTLNLTIEGNQVKNTGTNMCTNVTGNTSVEGSTLQQSASATLQITQASTAALAPRTAARS